MIKSILITVVMLLISMQAFAEPNSTATSRLEKQRTIVSELTALQSEYATLDADEGKLAQRYDDLKWAVEQNQKQVANFNAEMAQLNQDAEAYQASVVDHNARCAGTFSDPNYVDACNAEVPAGEARKQELIQRGNHLDTMRNLINESVRVNSEETQKVFSQHKANTARMEEIKVRHAALQVELKGILAEVDKCNAALKNATKERMHDVCGEMFDGNR